MDTAELVRHAIYTHVGAVRIALDGNTLSDMMGNNTVTVSPEEVTLLDAPGTLGWVDRMARARAQLSNNNKALADNLDAKSRYIGELGEAILVKAVEHEWYEEYDDFADEWDLPKRDAEYEVVITVRVMARNEEKAVEFAGEKFNISPYSDGVTTSPEYSAELVG